MRRASEPAPRPNGRRTEHAAAAREFQLGSYKWQQHGDGFRGAPEAQRAPAQFQDIPDGVTASQIEDTDVATLMQPGNPSRQRGEQHVAMVERHRATLHREEEINDGNWRPGEQEAGLSVIAQARLL